MTKGKITRPRNTVVAPTTAMAHPLLAVMFSKPNNMCLLDEKFHCRLMSTDEKKKKYA